MEIYKPQVSYDIIKESDCLQKTTHLAISAHADDIEMMALHGIQECFNSRNSCFSAIVVTNGAGSTKTGDYEQLNTQDIVLVRKKEQMKAAIIGEYSSISFLNYSSQSIKYGKAVEKDLEYLIKEMQPQIIYTHCIMDEHLTHIAVCKHVINVLKRIKDEIPRVQLFGCELWGGLDWLPRNRRIEFDVSRRSNLSNALIGIYDSQIDGAFL